LNYTRLKNFSTMTLYIGMDFNTFASRQKRHENAVYSAYKNPDSLGL